MLCVVLPSCSTHAHISIGDDDDDAHCGLSRDYALGAGQMASGERLSHARARVRRESGLYATHNAHAHFVCKFVCDSHGVCAHVHVHYVEMLRLWAGVECALSLR